jgi:hypothetical protein
MSRHGDKIGVRRSPAVRKACRSRDRSRCPRAASKSGAVMGQSPEDLSEPSPARGASTDGDRHADLRGAAIERNALLEHRRRGRGDGLHLRGGAPRDLYRHPSALPERSADGLSRRLPARGAPSGALSVPRFTPCRVGRASSGAHVESRCRALHRARPTTSRARAMSSRCRDEWLVSLSTRASPRIPDTASRPPRPTRRAGDPGPPPQTPRSSRNRSPL